MAHERLDMRAELAAVLRSRGNRIVLVRLIDGFLRTAGFMVRVAAWTTSTGESSFPKCFLIRAPHFAPSRVRARDASWHAPHPGAGRRAAADGWRSHGEWPRERFQKHGVSYRVAEKTKSELYQALLPRLNAGTIELLDDERCKKQLLALERRTSRGGRDTVDHPPNGKDDVINAVAGCAFLLRAGTASIATIATPEEQLADRVVKAIAESAQLAAAIFQAGHQQ